ncbi:hypothetical protein [Janthinobacterium sp. LB3P118]|uniref:hypothetical protein n=1 Tax=Janthinobacterium sp. LB3P118 TaxID=3424195 RepID=UPI003F2108D3
MKKVNSIRENGFNCSGFIINRLCLAEVRESPRGASLATQTIANEDVVLADLDVDLVGDLGNDQDLASSSDRAGIGAPIEVHIEAPIEEEVPIEELNTKFRKSCIQDRQADKEKYAGMLFVKLELCVYVHSKLKERGGVERTSLSRELVNVIRKMLTEQAHMDRVHQRICGASLAPRAFSQDQKGGHQDIDPQ